MENNVGLKYLIESFAFPTLLGAKTLEYERIIQWTSTVSKGFHTAREPPTLRDMMHHHTRVRQVPFPHAD